MTVCDHCGGRVFVSVGIPSCINCGRSPLHAAEREAAEAVAKNEQSLRRIRLPSHAGHAL